MINDYNNNICIAYQSYKRKSFKLLIIFVYEIIISWQLMCVEQ